MAKTKALISFAVTAKLICVFVFAYANIRFSHVAAHISTTSLGHSPVKNSMSQFYFELHLNIEVLPTKVFPSTGLDYSILLRKPA